MAAGLPLAFAVAACNQPAAQLAASPARAAVERIEGGYTDVGTGRISTYAEMNAGGGPKAVGVSFSSSFVNAPPASHSDQHRCADRNSDGVVDRPAECNMWHEWAIPLPTDATRRPDVLSKPDRCNPIKTAAAVERAGYYPTMSCVRYDTARDTYNVSMEEFVLRERSDPGPPALLAPPKLTSSNR